MSDAGQLLFQIDDREYKAALDQALGDLAQKEADYKRNQQDLARYKPLYRSAGDQQAGLRSRQSEHSRQCAAVGSRPRRRSRPRNSTSRWTQVNSPIDGVAGIAKTQVGDLVSPTSLLTTVSQLDPIKVDVSDQRARVPAFRRADQASIRRMGWTEASRFWK